MAVLGRWWGSLARCQGPEQQERDDTWAVGYLVRGILWQSRSPSLSLAVRLD